MENYKGKCTHCNKKKTYKVTGFENEITCKFCKKDMNVDFDFSKKTLKLY